MKKPLLSICIPTANRCNELKIAIDSIITQQPYLDGEVEIVVSDNSDTDDTRELMKQYPNHAIRYNKNQTNIRGLNFAKVLSLGTGIYRKLANDTISYRKNSIDQMVLFVKENMNKRPVLLWKTYQHMGVERAETENFEEAMRLCSYWTTWISTYGVWEDESDFVLDHCVKAADSFQTRLRNSREDDVMNGAPMKEVIGLPDYLWQIRYFAEMWKQRHKVSLQNCDRNWNKMPVKKHYPIGGLKWIFHDYYLSIMKEFELEKLLSEQCVFELERDLAFSFFVNYMVDKECGKGNITFEADDTLIEDILNIYKGKPYYNEFMRLYQEKREKAG